MVAQASTASPPRAPWAAQGSLLPFSFVDEVSQGVWSGFIHFIGSQGSFHCGPVTYALSMVIIPLPRREGVDLPPGWQFQTGGIPLPTSLVPQSGLRIHQLLWFPLTPASHPYESQGCWDKFPHTQGAHHNRNAVSYSSGDQMSEIDW